MLLDLRLPGMSGFEACARIRELHGPYLPVIMMTAFGDPVAVRRGYEAGADDFLHKPIDTPALILKVRAFLRLKSTHDELARSREEAQARARDLARLHEIGRDWSLIAEPFEFNRMLTQRLAGLIGAPIVGIALQDPETRADGGRAAGARPDRRARARPSATCPARSTAASGARAADGPTSATSRASDPRLAQEIGLMAEAQSVVLVPLLAEGELIGLLGRGGQAGRLHRRRRPDPLDLRRPGRHVPAQPARASTASAGRRRGSSDWRRWSATWRRSPAARGSSS